MGTQRRLDRELSIPLWRQLESDLRRRMDGGEFSTAFPGELALCEEYSVSRHTVRAALRRLREEGLVTAYRGRQPQVARLPEIVQPLGALYSLFAAVEGSGSVQRSVVRVLDERRDPAAAGRLDRPLDDPLVYLERVRLADEQPLALDRIWLPSDIAKPMLDVDFGHTALYDELAARCGVRLTGGREQVRAVVATAEERALLGIDPDVALLAVERIGLVDKARVELRHTLVRGDRYAVSAEFSARAGYRVGVGERFTAD